MSGTLTLPARYYRVIPMDRPGYEAAPVTLEADRTALVAMHCWDIGCEGGPRIDPNFFVGQSCEACFQEAERIMIEAIRPAMDAARRAGIAVCHVEHPLIWARHPDGLEDLDPPGPALKEGPTEVVPGHRAKIVARSHGPDFETASPYARMDRARVVAALPGEPFVLQTSQFDRILRRRGIENLVYAGFAADMCILRAPGGAEPMAGYGYRLLLLRDATLGVEYPDTLEERLATRWGIRYFETHLGDTVTTGDFIRACAALSP